MRFLLPALVAMAVLPVGAHHPFTPHYDISKPASISGPIVELRTVTLADGTKMLFGSTTPTSSDSWRCTSDPCPQYTYPVP